MEKLRIISLVTAATALIGFVLGCLSALAIDPLVALQTAGLLALFGGGSAFLSSTLILIGFCDEPR